MHSRDDEYEIAEIEQKTLLKGLRFNVLRKKISIDEKIVERDVVEFPDSVVILPVLKTDKIILIKQYRPAINDYIYEVPAGIVEPSEPVKEAAVRELIEETGYEPKELIDVGNYFPTPGYSTEKMHFFIARDLEYVGMKPEPYEVIKPVVVSLVDALEMIKNNQIQDLKTVALILYYASFIWKKDFGED